MIGTRSTYISGLSHVLRGDFRGHAGIFATLTAMQRNEVHRQSFHLCVGGSQKTRLLEPV